MTQPAEGLTRDEALSFLVPLVATPRPRELLMVAWMRRAGGAPCVLFLFFSTYASGR
jgi:hypothetical protein